MTHYELLYIVPAQYAVEEIDKVYKNVRELITKFSGEIAHEENLGKQKLAYPIASTHQGYYVAVEFNAEPAQMKELDQKIKLTKEVLRHMIVVKTIKTAEEIQKEQQIKEIIAKDKETKLKEDLEKDPTTVTEAPVLESKSKVSLEELNKKIDELLDEGVV